MDTMVSICMSRLDAPPRYKVPSSHPSKFLCSTLLLHLHTQTQLNSPRVLLLLKATFTPASCTFLHCCSMMKRRSRDSLLLPTSSRIPNAGIRYLGQAFRFTARSTLVSGPSQHTSYSSERLLCSDTAVYNTVAVAAPLCTGARHHPAASLPTYPNTHRQQTRPTADMPILLPPGASEAGENNLSYSHYTRTHRAKSA